MKRKLVALLLLTTLLLISAGALLAQTVVKDTANVRKPAYGKLYFQKSDTTLYLYTTGYKPIRAAAMPGGPSEPKPTPTPTPDIPIGYWEQPDRLLVAKQVAGQYYLMQTNAAGSYYVARGRNLLTDTRTKVSPTATAAVASLASSTSAIGGLAPAANFPEAEFLKLGYTKNTQGEYVVTPSVVEEPPVTNNQKIKIPAGLIMWDNWTYDYWADPAPKYDYLINHITRNRYTATVFADEYNLVPFYGRWHAPEAVKIRTNVKWNQALGRNTYDEIEKNVIVAYNKTPADTEREVRYYREAGFDFLCFNYYNTDSYLSEARQHFVAMADKLGMQMTLKVQNRRSDAEIAHIAGLMAQPYWFRINGQAVLYMNATDFDDLPKYQAALRQRGGGEIYVVYYGFDGYPGDWADYQARRPAAISAYNTTIGGTATAEQQLQKELTDRAAWMGQYAATSIQLIPVLSLGLENLDLRTDLGSGGKPVGIIAKASLEQQSRKFELVSEFIKAHPTKVPAIIWNSGNEINESGESYVPKLLRNGTIDTSRLDVARRWLE